MSWIKYIDLDNIWLLLGENARVKKCDERAWYYKCGMLTQGVNIFRGKNYQGKFNTYFQVTKKKFLRNITKVRTLHVLKGFTSAFWLSIILFNILNTHIFLTHT